MSIYVVRHGQTDWNLQKKVQGRRDTALNKTGIRQAQEVKEMLKDKEFSKVISSPLKRAKQTAEIIFEGKVIEDERITERDFGEFEGLRREEFASNQFWSYKSNLYYEHAENIKDFFKRTYDFLEELERKEQDKDILLVTHTGNLLAIDTYFNGIPEDDNLFRVDLKNCSVIKYDFK